MSSADIYSLKLHSFKFSEVTLSEAFFQKCEYRKSLVHELHTDYSEIIIKNPKLEDLSRFFIN